MHRGGNILETIVQHKQGEVARLPSRPWTSAQLRELIETRGARRDFAAALRHPPRGDLALIAEIKKASPSAGVICADFDPVRIARAYESAGAACLSVLTDEAFFQGSLAHLKAVRQAVGLPLLRKDFIIDERQIAEAIEWGADALLLIVAILSDQQLRHFHALATEAGLAALVEAHDLDELQRALDAGARLIGINNRDLKTFQVDLAVTERAGKALASRLDSGEVFLVAESGIHRREDVLRLKAAGARAMLVGESLMRQPDVPGKIAQLLNSRSDKSADEPDPRRSLV